MALSWNEIKDRALHFSKEWADTSNEEADAKPFLNDFFEVFGITRKRVSTFEHKVKKLDESNGYIDLLWKGTILIEMKSRGKNLDKAYQQAIEYTHGLKQHELPKYILVCDFETFKLYDLEENKNIEFKLNDLVNNVQHFGYILGYIPAVFFAGSILKSGLSYRNMAQGAIVGVLTIHICGVFYMLFLAALHRESALTMWGWVVAQSGTKILYDMLFSFIAMAFAKATKKLLWIAIG